MEQTDTEEKMDNLLETMKLPQEEDLDVLIEQRINRRIRRIVLQALAVVTAAAVVLLLVLSPLMNALYTDPYKLNSDAKTDENGQLTEESTLCRTLDAWLEAQFPYCETDYVQVERKGFGRYEIHAHILDLKESVQIKGPANVRFAMRRNDLRIEQNFSGMMSFSLDFERDESVRTVESDMEKISELPESAWICAAVSAERPDDIDDIRLRNAAGVSIDWAEVYTEDAGLNLGLNLRHVIQNDAQGIREEMSSKQLKELYLSQLELLDPKTNLWTEAFGLCSNTGTSLIQYSPSASAGLLDELKNAASASHVFQTRYYYISGSRDAVLNFLNAEDVRCVRIVHARLWRGY